MSQPVIARETRLSCGVGNAEADLPGWRSTLPGRSMRFVPLPPEKKPGFSKATRSGHEDGKMVSLLMLKFLLGIVLVQAATVIIVLLAPSGLQGAGLLRVIVPVLFISFLSAFWFASMAHHLRKDHLAKAREQFARERESLRVDAERSKARVMKQAQKDIAKEARVTHAKANFKVGAAFTGVMGLGALLLLTQFLTVGLVTLSAAGGALGGYLYRGRRYKATLGSSANGQLNGQLIEVNPKPVNTKPALDKKSV
jgi:hypothetical protein